jgi:hypothetical protein
VGTSFDGGFNLGWGPGFGRKHDGGCTAILVLTKEPVGWVISNLVQGSEVSTATTLPNKLFKAKGCKQSGVTIHAASKHARSGAAGVSEKGEGEEEVELEESQWLRRRKE